MIDLTQNKIEIVPKNMKIVFPPEEGATFGADLINNVQNNQADYIAGSRNYNAVVDVNGNGDYSNIQAAINAGKTIIFLRKGTYTLTADLIISSGVSLIGEDKFNTIINLNGSNMISAAGSGEYNTGTLAVTYNSDIVTGTGTAWSTNLSADQYIIINKNAFKIKTVDSDTQITLYKKYEGRTESGLDYNSGSFKSNIELRNFTITGQSGLVAQDYALYLSMVVNSTIKNLIITKNDLSYTNGLHLVKLYNNFIDLLDISNNGYRGIEINNSHNNTISNIDCNNNTRSGIEFTGSASENRVTNLNVSNNKYGLYINGGALNVISNVIANNCYFYGVICESAPNNTISNVVASNNRLEAIMLKFSNNIIVSNFEVYNNQQHGIRFYGSSYCILSNCILRNNGQALNDFYSEIYLDNYGGNLSIYNIIANNNIYCSASSKKCKYGIRESSTNEDYNLVHGNIVQGAVTANISLQGVNSVNADNI